jgi:hypothetical protein
MEKMCAEAFAMVGGGLVFDDQEFPRFHECKMIDIPGYTVTATKAESDGQVQPVPNPSNVKPTGWLLWAKANRSADLAKPLFLAGNAVTTKNVALQLAASWDVVGGLGAKPEIIEYNSAGEASYAPYAQQIKDKGVTYLSFIGTRHVHLGSESTRRNWLPPWSHHERWKLLRPTICREGWRSSRRRHCPHGIRIV